MSKRASVVALVTTATSLGEVPRHHHHATGQRRVERASGAWVSAHNRSFPVGRAGTLDDVGAVGALLIGPDGIFITGSDFFDGMGA